MISPELYPRDVTLAEARVIQKRLRDMVVEEGATRSARYVAGVDISVLRGSGPAVAAAILVELPDLRVVEEAVAIGELTFPYVPGFLSFREAPLMMDALAKLRTQPDVIIVEGHGRAHPRRLGIASHLGLIVGKQTVGFAKSKLVGHFEEPGSDAGSASPLEDKGEVIGTVVRTKARVKPVFVSVGHMVSLSAAVELVLRCTAPRQRLPEPIRLAHLKANEARRAEL